MYDVCVIFNTTDIEALTPEIYDYVNSDGSSKDLRDAHLALELAGEEDRELSVVRYIVDGEEVSWHGDPLDFIQHHAYLSDAEEGPQLTSADIQRLKARGVWHAICTQLAKEDSFFKTSFHRRGIDATPEDHFIDYVLEIWPWWAMSYIDQCSEKELMDATIPEKIVHDLIAHHSHRVIVLSNSLYICDD